MHHLFIRIRLVEHIDHFLSVRVIGFRPFLLCIWLKKLHEVISGIDKLSLKYHFKRISSRKIRQLARPLIIYHFVCCLPLFVFVWHINKLKNAILIRQMIVGDELEPVLFRGRPQIVPSVSLW